MWGLIRFGLHRLHARLGFVPNRIPTGQRFPTGHESKNVDTLTFHPCMPTRPKGLGANIGRGPWILVLEPPSPPSPAYNHGCIERS